MSGECTAHDVCANCWMWVEGSGEVNLLQPLAWSPKAGPWGRCICHPVGRVPDLQRRNWGPLPSSIHAQEVAQTPIMQAQMGMGGNEGHFVFPERLPKAEERWAVRRKWRTRAHKHLSILPLGQSHLERKEGHFRWMRACRGQRGLLAGPGSHCHIGGADRKAQSVNYQNEARHPPLFTKPRPAEKVPRAELKAP